MFRAIAASSCGRRIFSLALITVISTVAFTVDDAHARRRHHRHHARVSSYSPPFSSIVVDANSGATLQSNNADSLRHPASLTKIMTLYLLFERLQAGKIKLDTDLPVSEHASEQAPTKLGLKPGQTIAVEDAIKGLVTRSANDAAATIAEALAGSEDDFARLMTRKARALGMSKTVYRNASGLPNDAQVTTARDQSILGRSIQERFPQYYRYFATSEFRYRGSVIRNHNRLLGRVEGVDGIKTGYTRASGFNLVTSMRRGNRHLVAVVLGGRSGSSRDAAMRNLLAEHIDEASTKRTVAAITERNAPESKTFDDRIAAVAPQRAKTEAASTDEDEENVDAEVASAEPEKVAAAPPAQPKTTPVQRPAALTNGVVSAQQLPIPGSTEPLQPKRVKTLVVRAAPIKVASAGPTQPAMVAPTTTSSLPERTASARPEAQEAVQPVALQPNVAKNESVPQPAEYGTGKGILGVLPARSGAAMASAEPAARPQTMMAAAMPAPPAQAAPVPNPVPAVATPSAAPTSMATQHPSQSTKPTLKAGTWIVQVGALESEAEANKRLAAARASANALLGKAIQFTEEVDRGEKRLYRARFANLDRDQAEAACRTLKKSEISCFAIKN